MQPEIDLGEKLKNRIFAPTGRRKKQAGLELNWGKKLKKEYLLQREEGRSKLNWGKS